MVARPTKRERTTRCLGVRTAVARALADSVTLTEAAPGVLRAVAANFGWEMAEWWGVDHTAGQLHRVASWTEAAPADAGRETKTLGSGDGLPDQVWQSGRSVWITYPTPAQGWQSTAGFPVALENRVSAVLAFFSREVRQPEDELLKTMATIGGQIGPFIEHSRKVEDRLEREEFFRLFGRELQRSDLSGRPRVPGRLRKPFCRPTAGSRAEEPVRGYPPRGCRGRPGVQVARVSEWEEPHHRPRARAAGTWRWMEASATLVRHRGQPHVMAVYRDVTDRH